MGKLRKDLTGLSFGYLDVIEFGDRVSGKARWHCVCRCGNRATVDGYYLTSGHTKSCGCKRYEAPPGVIKHGLSKSRAHRIWRKMLERCTNPNAAGYENYGGRGIAVCDQWLSFENFYADMGAPPDGMSIERRDNNGDYSPENCCWIPMVEQAKNKRSVAIIRRHGQSKTIREWCDEVGLKPGTVKHRMRAGWPDCRLFDPVRQHQS